MVRRHAILPLLAVIVLSISSCTLRAQPSLRIGRISVNGTENFLFIQARCGSDLRLDLTKENFRLVEEGKEIKDFQVACPDPNRHCCISVAIVIDKSQSMKFGSPSPLQTARECSRAFIDAMDPDGSGCDEAALIGFDTSATLAVPMTNDKVTLKAGIDFLSAGGATSVWDAGLDGVRELVKSGTQECRAVILLTDGDDNRSIQTPDSLIAFALENKLRIFTIDLGNGINVFSLQRIASATGGKYYFAPSPSVLVAIYKEISAIGGGFSECEIRYGTGNQCKDGSMHTVELTLQRLFGCPGTSIWTKQYRAPLDTAGFSPVSFTIPADTAQEQTILSVPLLLENLAAERISPFDVRIPFDTTRLLYADFRTAGCILDTIASAVTLSGDTLRIRTSEWISSAYSAPLVILNFLARETDQEIVTSLAPAATAQMHGCIKPAFHAGIIHILPAASTDFPEAGSILFSGKNYLLKWRLHNTFIVDLELSRDGGQTFQRTVSGVAADTFIWHVPTDLPSGSEYRFRIRGTDGKYNLIGGGPFIIDQPPRIAEQPADDSVCIGGTAEFRAKADSSLHSPVQWQRSTDSGLTWKNIPGGRSDTIPITASSPTDDGANFRAVYTSPYSTTISRSATLFLRFPPDTADISADQELCAGENAHFDIHWNASPAPIITWQVSTNGFDWKDIADASGARLTLQNVQMAQSGTRYRAIVSNLCGARTTSAARLTIMTPPAILRQPLSRIVLEKDSVALTISATGSGLRFQWEKDGVPLIEENDSVLILSPVRREDAGTYRVVVRGYCGGKLYSDSAVIVVELVTAVRSVPAIRDMRFTSSYPNPFSSSVSIGFSTTTRSRVELRICDLHGRRVRGLCADRMEPGEHLFTWDGRNDAGIRMAPGVYCALLALDGKISMRKLTLVQ